MAMIKLVSSERQQRRYPVRGRPHHSVTRAAVRLLYRYTLENVAITVSLVVVRGPQKGPPAENLVD